MTARRRWIPRTIAAQITCIVIAAVLLGVGLASIVVFSLFNNSQGGANQDVWAIARAARIAAIVQKVKAIGDPRQVSRVLDTYRSASLDIDLVPISRLETAPRRRGADTEFLAKVRRDLAETWALAPLPAGYGSDRGDAIVLPLDAGAALVFVTSPRSTLHNLVLVQTICALAIVVFIVSFLSLYALRSITFPLSSIAAAARSFGRSSGDGDALSTDGPREIAQVAEALNDMRERVRALVNERTQMLLAISHDLRTPLTRLRLRAERLSDASLRDNMLRDVATINEMLGETLAYLREGGPAEPAQLVDVPSLLQTVCAEFTDIGHAVSYAGPDRLAWGCRVNALNRAIANLVDNATKHGARVVVTLTKTSEDEIQIDVTDDGPGIPAELREKVFEPFYKGDSARHIAGRGGFGLGLSIAREIARRHGGEIRFLDHQPRGLTARLTSKTQPLAANWAYRAAE
jgi:signal transduction histidine kinase